MTKLNKLIRKTTEAQNKVCRFELEMHDSLKPPTWEMLDEYSHAQFKFATLYHKQQRKLAKRDVKRIYKNLLK